MHQNTYTCDWLISQRDSPHNIYGCVSTHGCTRPRLTAVLCVAIRRPQVVPRKVGESVALPVKVVQHADDHHEQVVGVPQTGLEIARHAVDRVL